MKLLESAEDVKRSIYNLRREILLDKKKGKQVDEEYLTVLRVLHRLTDNQINQIKCLT